MQISPQDYNLNIIGKRPEKFRLIVIGDINEEGFPTMEKISEAIKGFNCNNKAWTIVSQISSPIEERFMLLKEVVVGVI